MKPSLKKMIFLFILVPGLLLSTHSPAKSKGSFKFCHGGPMVSIVKNPKRQAFQSCNEARVHIQALMWKCDQKNKAQQNTKEFFNKIKDEARRKCIEFCEDQETKTGERCRARFEPPKDCGFFIDPDHPGDVHERFGCRSGCEAGDYASYCSLYHGAFLRPEPSLILDKPENCFCEAKK